MGVALPRRVVKNFDMARWGYGFAGAICCLALQLGAVAQSVSYSAGSQESQLVSLERLWNEAPVHRDSQALGSMIADKFVNTEWDGEVSDRGKFLADIADPKFESASLTIQDVKVTLFQSTAVVTGTYRSKGSYNNKSYDHLGRFTDTWVFADGKWQCVASHTSLLQK
ncbi:MAG TPA: nuclear transport factor 2 family protein [Terriglobales bacterium]|nr:nuclear transport factor 2 family protein [Terriglobales bacterium]